MIDKNKYVIKDGKKDLVRESLLPVDVNGKPITNILSTMTDGKYDIDTKNQTKEDNQTAIQNAQKKMQEDIESLTADYPQAEKDTFWIQELEAKAYTDDNTASTPFIENLATSRGISKAELVTKILANAQNLKNATAVKLGEYQAFVDSLK